MPASSKFIRLFDLVFRCFLCLCVPIAATAATHTVGLDGDHDFGAIQPAVNACQVGDTVLVAPGVYTGAWNREIDFHGVDLLLISETGSSGTTIDCEDLGRAVNLSSGESLFSKIQGVTMRNGNGDSDFGTGGAIQCRYSSLSLVDVTIESSEASHGGGISIGWGELSMQDCNLSNCLAFGSGGGVNSYEASLDIRNSLISGNTSNNGGGIDLSSSTLIAEDTIFQGNQSGWGGGIYIIYGSTADFTNVNFIDNHGSYDGAIGISQSGQTLNIYDCLFQGNSAGFYGGAIRIKENDALIENSLFVGNSAHGGGGISLYFQAHPTIRQCTIVSNWETGWGGGGLKCASDSDPILDRVIVAGNLSGGGIHTDQWSEPILSCCDVWGNIDGDFVGEMADPTGQDGNFSLDPLFCDVLNPVTPYSLQPESPCTPAGNSCELLIGAFDVGCATTATEASNFSRIKTLY